MVGYGIGAIIGSGAFGTLIYIIIEDFTMCFGITCLVSFYYH
jgi:hypothetical protein